MNNPMNDEFFAQLEMELNKDVVLEQASSPKTVTNVGNMILQMSLVSEPLPGGEHRHKFVFHDSAGTEEIFDATCEMFDQMLNELGLLVSKLAFTREFDKLNPRTDDEEEDEDNDAI